MTITTKVDENFLNVKAGFTEKLFLALNPPFPKVSLLQFDGCKKGDIVSLELNFIFFKQVWKSLITEDETSKNEFRFVDEGTNMPFFFKYWRHHHRVIADGNSSRIVDDITFKTPILIPAFLVYPALYLQFLYRRPVYKRYFQTSD